MSNNEKEIGTLAIVFTNAADDLPSVVVCC